MKRLIHLMLLLTFLFALFFGFASHALAWPVSVSFRKSGSGMAGKIATTRRVKKYLKKYLRKYRVRYQRRGVVSRGLHFYGNLKLIFRSSRGVIPSCTVEVKSSIVKMPEKRLVFLGKSSGFSRYRRYRRLSWSKKKGICIKALKIAIRKLASSMKPIERKVKAMIRNLKKNQILGQPYRGAMSGGTFVAKAPFDLTRLYWMTPSIKPPAK